MSLAVGLLLAAAVSSAPTAPKVKWEKSFTAARLRAKAEAKPIMIDFWAEWCGWCHELDKTTYRDPRVVELAGRVVAVKVDTEGSRSEAKIAEQYRVESLPTITFVSPEGRTIFRVNGYQSPEAFASTMEHALELASHVVEWEAALAKDPKDATALAKLGEHLFDSELYEDSRDLLLRAAAVDQERPTKERKRTRTLLGIIQHFATKYTEAEKVLNEALALKPVDADEDAAALYTLGRVYMKTGKTAEARTAFNKVVERYPDTKPASRARESLETLGQ